MLNLNPIICQRLKGDETEPYESKIDNRTIKNQMAQLSGVPDYLSHVYIDGMNEIYSGLPNENEFKVDYKYGYVYFNLANDNQNVNISFSSTGISLFPSDRIYVPNAEGTVDKTLQTIVDTYQDKIDELDASEVIRVSNEDTRISNETLRQTQEASRQTNTTTAINSLNAATTQNTLIWKTPVANYATGVSTYTSAQNGWAFQALDDGKCYRYSGSSWVYFVKGNINPTKYYLWQETKTVNSGSNSFTLTNGVQAGQLLEIIDTKYGCVWVKDVHYSISGQVVTLTESALSESLTFQITNFG